MCDDMHVKALKIAVKLPMYNGGNAMNTILGRAGISMDPHPNAANAQKAPAVCKCQRFGD